MCQPARQAGGQATDLGQHTRHRPACGAPPGMQVATRRQGCSACKSHAVPPHLLVLALWGLAPLQPQHVHQSHLLTAVQQLLPRGNQHSRRRWRLSCAHNTCPTPHAHTPPISSTCKWLRVSTLSQSTATAGTAHTSHRLLHQPLSHCQVLSACCCLCRAHLRYTLGTATRPLGPF